MRTLFDKPKKHSYVKFNSSETKENIDETTIPLNPSRGTNARIVDIEYPSYEIEQRPRKNFCLGFTLILFVMIFILIGLIPEHGWIDRAF